MTLAFPERIDTSRTVLTAWRADDGAALKRALDHNAEHLVPWIPWATGAAVPLAEAEERVRRFAEEFRSGTNFTWAIRDRDRAALIGGTGLHPRIGAGGLEIGYWIDRDHVGRGLAREVTEVLIALAFGESSIDRVEIHVDERNVPSVWIPKRLGFTLIRTEHRPGDVRLMIWRLWRPGPGERWSGGRPPAFVV